MVQQGRMAQTEMMALDGTDGNDGADGNDGNDGADGAGAAPVQDEGVEVVTTPIGFNFVGDGVVVTDDSGVATVTIASGGGGGTPAQTHDLWAGWSTDDTVTETEVLAAASSDTNTVTLPTSTGNQYLFIWRSDTDGGDPDEVHIAGAGNTRNSFGAAAALTVSGNAGQVIVSVTTQNSGLLGGEDVRVV